MTDKLSNQLAIDTCPKNLSLVIPKVQIDKHYLDKIVNIFLSISLRTYATKNFPH